MNNPILTKENENLKVEIYYDCDAISPCQGWEMATKFLFGYLGRRTDELSTHCNYEDFTKEASDCTIHEAIEELVLNHVSGAQIFNFCKKTGLIEYNSSSKFWEAPNGEEYTKKEILEITWCTAPFHDAELSDLVALLRKHGKNIAIQEFSSCGYSQGDYIEGVMYTTKRHFEKINGKCKDWKRVAYEQMQDDFQIMERWFWGDVYGFQKFEKVEVVKSYPQIPDREDVISYEWEEVVSCWGFFDEPEELAERVLAGAI